MRTIAAQDATVGASYKNARGSRLTVTEIPPDPAQVSVRLESGTVTSVPRAYPLELTDAPPAPETVAHGAIDAIRAAATTWEVEDLEDLADLDHRPEVQDLIRQELGKRQPPPAPEDPIANPWGVPADFHAPKPTEVVATLTRPSSETRPGSNQSFWHISFISSRLASIRSVMLSLHRTRYFPMGSV